MPTNGNSDSLTRVARMHSTRRLRESDVLKHRYQSEQAWQRGKSDNNRVLSATSIIKKKNSLMTFSGHQIWAKIGENKTLAKSR